MNAFGVAGIWSTLALAIVLSIIAGVGSVWLANRDAPESDPSTPSLAPFISTVGIVYGALLGFTVVVAWEQFSSAEVNVANEASTLTTMYRQTVGMPEPERTDMREQLREYANTVVGPEWDAQTTVDNSERARAAITEMYVVFGRQDADAASNPVSQEFLGQLTVLASDRNQRFLDAQPRVPVMMWVGLLVGGTVLIGLMAAIRLPSRRGHMLLSGTVAALLGLLLFIVYWLDHPFGTELGVTPAPFERALVVFDAIDQGPREG